MNERNVDPAVVLVAALIAELNLARDAKDRAIAERDDIAATAMRLDADLVDALGLVETLEQRLAGALAELAVWNAAADTVGPVGTPD